MHNALSFSQQKYKEQIG